MSPATDATPGAKASNSQIAEGSPSPQDIESGMNMLEAGRKDIPREAFEPAELVKKLGSDPQVLFEWVRQNTYWVPYRGVLRGAQGVLMDRTGNSVDRALLLAELLRIAGHTSRLVQTTLTKEQASKLSPGVRKIPEQSGRAAAPNAELTTAQFESYAQRFKLDAETLRLRANSVRQRATGMRNEVLRRVESQAPFLISKVGEPGGRGLDPQREADALRDHWWVQRSENGKWIDLDLLAPDPSESPLRGTGELTFPYSGDGSRLPLGREFTHGVEIRVVFEQRTNGAPSEHIALTHRVSPAEMLNQMAVLRVLPTDWSRDIAPPVSADPFAWFKEQALKQKRWVPVLIMGSRVISGLAVTDSGDLESAQRSGPQQLQKPMSSVFDAFGGGEPESERHLTAGWVDYELTAPGETRRTIRRELFDLVDPTVRLQEQAKAVLQLTDPMRLERSLSLIQEVQILLQVGRVRAEYVASRSIEELLQNRKALTALAADLKEGVKVSPQTFEAIVPTSGRLLDLAFARFEWSPVGNDVFLREPSILTYRTKYGSGSDQRTIRWHGFDIVNGRVSVVPDRQSSPFKVRVAQGVADTNAESILVGSDGVVNAGAQLNASTRPDQSWSTVLRERATVRAEGKWPSHVMGLLDRDLQGGHALVLPSSAQRLPGTSGWTWWQVDPVTGDTLGKGDLGWGQATAEYVAAGWISFLVFFVACNVYTIANNNPTPGKCFCFAMGIGFAVAGAPLEGWLVVGVTAAAGVPALWCFVNYA